MTAPAPAASAPAAVHGPALLHRVRIVECAQGVAGPFAGKLLADFGADVIKIEPPAGDAARRDGPFHDALPHRETSAVFLQHNTSKRSVRLDLATRAGRRLLDALLSTARVFLSDRTLADAAPLHLQPERLRADHPHLLVVAVTPHGLHGPDAEIPTTPFTAAHRAAATRNLVNAFGPSADPPVPIGGRAFEADAGLAAAVAIVAALLVPGDQGQGIDIALQDALMSLDRVDNSLAVNGPTPPTNTAVARDARLPCRDGAVTVATGPLHQWRALIGLLGDPPWAFAADGQLRPRREIRERMREALVAWAARRTRAEVYHASQEAGAPTGAVLTPAEVLDSAQERARGFFQPLPHPLAGALRYPRFAAHIHSPESGLPGAAAPPQARTPAPRLGAHTKALLGPHLHPWTAAQARRAGVA